MHEVSIVRALVRLAREHVPSGAHASAVHIRVGPLHSIVAETLNAAWFAATTVGPLCGARLDVEYLRWQWECRDCGRRWEGELHDEACACGCARTNLRGADDLTLLSIDVDAAPKGCVPEAAVQDA